MVLVVELVVLELTFVWLFVDFVVVFVELEVGVNTVGSTPANELVLFWEDVFWATGYTAVGAGSGIGVALLWL